MLENGYIKEYRSLLSWGWFREPFTAHLWEYIRLAANWEEHRFKGHVIQRGQLVTSYPSMAEATGMTIQSVRTAVKHLKKTGEITMQSFRDFSIITVTNYEKYQSEHRAARQKTAVALPAMIPEKTPTENNGMIQDAEQLRACFETAFAHYAGCGPAPEPLTEAIKKSLHENAEPDLIRAVIEEASLANANHPAKYVISILQKLRTEQIHDVAGFQARREQHKGQKKPIDKMDRKDEQNGQDGTSGFQHAYQPAELDTLRL